MSNQTVEVESEDYFEKSRSKQISKIKEAIVETFVRDKNDFLDELSSALDIDVEELPSVEVSIHIKFGKHEIVVPGFEAEEKDEDEDE